MLSGTGRARVKGARIRAMAAMSMVRGCILNASILYMNWVFGKMLGFDWFLYIGGTKK